MDKYILVVGGCGWDCTFNQRADGSYSETPDYEAPGSKGSNQAVGVAKAGARCKIISAIGGDVYGDKIKQNLENYGIDTSAILEVEGSGSDRCEIFVDNSGNNKMRRAPGSIQYITRELMEDNAELIEGASCVVMQSKISKDAYKSLIEMCYKAGVPTVLTPCPFDKLLLSGEDANENRKLLNKVTHITANKHEAFSITGTTDIAEALSILPNLIITAGARGAYYLNDNNEVINSPSLKPERIVDKTGAGDTLSAFFTAGVYYHGMSKSEAVDFGIKASTLKLEGHGAQSSIPTREQINSRHFELDIQEDYEDDPDLVR